MLFSLAVAIKSLVVSDSIMALSKIECMLLLLQKYQDFSEKKVSEISTSSTAAVTEQVHCKQKN